MGLMAYVALFYFLISEIAMQGGNQFYDYSMIYNENGGRITLDAQTFVLYLALAKYGSPGRLARFFLFSRRSPERSMTLDIENPQSLLNFDPDLGTKIIVHGFLDNIYIASWMHDMKDELLIYENYNVIIVDWSAGNSLPYFIASRNTEKVGEEISELIRILLNEYGASPELFHLIGHSLGSHIAGYVGENIKNIGRITGLDPAAPRFENEHPRCRLDPSDAIFVDVLHTDAGGIGLIEPTGHQDFYPNAGREQPGCTASNSLRALVHEGVIEGARNLICSHMRAPHLFTSSINSNCHMIGVLCDSWKEFERGHCNGCGASGERCAVMGFHADRRKTGQNWFETYYLVTASREPYCAGYPNMKNGNLQITSSKRFVKQKLY